MLKLWEMPGELDVVDGKRGPIEHRWIRFSDGVILDPCSRCASPSFE